MDGDEPHLRFGVMASGTTLRRWQADVVRSLLDVPGVELGGLIVDARPRPPRDLTSRARRLRQSKHLVWDLYNNGWVGRRAPSLQPVDLRELFATVPHVDVVVEVDGWSERFPSSAVDAVRALELDVLLRFDFGIIRGDILDAARLGVWSYHHDDEEAYRGSPPAFWELVDGQPVSGAVLQRLTDRLDGGYILDRGWFRSVDHSYARNTDVVHAGATEWPARVARAVLAGDDGAAQGVLSTSTAPISKKPSNAVAVRFLAAQAGRFVASQARALAFADEWEIGLVRAPIQTFLDPGFRPAVEWLDLGTALDGYAADPFCLVTDDGPVVLYERFTNDDRTGEVWQAPLSLTSDTSDASDVAELAQRGARPASLPIDAHASYPYTFEADGRRLCLPQVTGAPPALHERVGDGWRVVPADLPTVPLLDPTIVWHDGRWWLFATRPGRDSLTKLWLWWAPAIEGPWMPHRGNPVKTDVRSARPAGTPFVHDGRLHRPAQDCARGYGTAVALCEVTALDEEHFTERVVRVVEADQTWPYPHGIHTLSVAGECTLLDARRRAVSRHETSTEIRARLARLRRPGRGPSDA